MRENGRRGPVTFLQDCVMGLYGVQIEQRDKSQLGKKEVLVFSG